MDSRHSFNRRRFLQTSLALATTHEIARTARALGLMVDAPVCRLTTEQEVGPFYIENETVRSDIAEGKAGVPLTLRIVVLNARTCAPLTHAAVDVWHCDALGLYAGYTSQNPGGPGETPSMSHPTDGLTFLRGIQITDSDGSVDFSTIFPGFYMGRTNHIHLKVRVGGDKVRIGSDRTYQAGHTSHVGQVFFPEEIAASLMQHAPYSRHTIHRTTQQEDDTFGSQHGMQSVVTLRPARAGELDAGFNAELVVAVDPTAMPAPARGGGGPGPVAE